MTWLYNRIGILITLLTPPLPTTLLLEDPDGEEGDGRDDDGDGETPARHVPTTNSYANFMLRPRCVGGR